MEKEVGLAYKIAIDLIITAIIIGVVISFTVMTNKSVLINKQHKAIKQNTEVYAELHQYDDRIMTGSDVVDIILTYSRIYDFTVRLPEGDKYFNSTAENIEVDGKSLGLKLWSKSNVEKTLGNSINSTFLVSLKNKDGTYITGLNFSEESTDPIAEE